MATEPTKTISVRLPPEAIEVLDWEAKLRGSTFRGELREELEQRAEAIAREHDLPGASDQTDVDPAIHAAGDAAPDPPAAPEPGPPRVPLDHDGEGRIPDGRQIQVG